MAATFEEVHGPSVLDYFEKNGLTLAALTKQLKEELKAKDTKFYKIKGAVNRKKLPKNTRIIAESGFIYHDKDGDSYGDGETLLAVDVKLWNTTQGARIDAHKLRGDYPASKNEYTGKDGGPIECVNYTNLDRANRLNFLIQQAISRKKENKV